MGIFSSGQTRAANMALALRTIEGNLAFTDQAAWAWFALPTQRWAFRADGERLNLIIDTATRMAALSGRRLHLRVTSRPYPAASWARATARAQRSANSLVWRNSRTWSWRSARSRSAAARS